MPLPDLLSPAHWLGHGHAAAAFAFISGFQEGEDLYGFLGFRACSDDDRGIDRSAPLSRTTAGTLLELMLLKHGGDDADERDDGGDSAPSDLNPRVFDFRFLSPQ